MSGGWNFETWSDYPRGPIQYPCVRPSYKVDISFSSIYGHGTTCNLFKKKCFFPFFIYKIKENIRYDSTS